MTQQRFNFRDAGTNCLDGNPDDKWMNFDPDGTIGNNCPNGEDSFDVDSGGSSPSPTKGNTYISSIPILI